MEIKTSLKQLVGLFAKSASNEEMPVPIRQFAAQMTILTAHVERVESKTDAIMALVKKSDGHISELADHIMALRPAASASASAPAAQTGAPAEAASPEAGEGEVEDPEAMEARMQAETAAEAAALNAAAQVAAITPLRKSNGGKKAGAGDAA